MLYDFLIEIKHNCHFSRLSKNHPLVQIKLWCNGSENDILELRGEKLELEKAINDIEKELGAIVNLFPEHNRVQLIINRCECDRLPLASIYENHDCIKLPPVRFFAGSEVVHLLITAENTGLLLEDIRKKDPEAIVKVLKLASIKDTFNPYPFILPLDELKTSLTIKQLKAITNAYNNGYYDLPRSVSVDTLANEMSIHRRTFEEHLRKAERKIMEFLIPNLNL
jgi:predicted DNA binding protein